MILPYLLAFVSVAVVSLISLVGVFALSLSDAFLRKYMFLFISLAVGSLLGDAFIHLIPESFNNLPTPAYTSVLVIVGILLFFILEKFLHWHHHGEDETEEHVQPVGNLILVSDGVHNLIDGVIIGVSFMISIPVGIATSIAVILHELPQEIGDFSVLLHAGYSRKKALWLNFLSALTAVVGVGIAFVLGEAGNGIVLWILPMAAGGFIYIAVADLIPELHKTKETWYSVMQIVALFAGVLMMLGLLFID